MGDVWRSMAAPPLNNASSFSEERGVLGAEKVRHRANFG
jgi:hypothetical protein